MSPKPPIEGFPAVRLRCPHCAGPVPYFTDNTRAANRGPIIRRVFHNWRGYPIYAAGQQTGERFCTLRCAYAFANAAYAAGYRIVREEKAPK